MGSFADNFYQNFIQENRYEYILDGLGVTLIITFFSVLIGILLGFIVAMIRSTYDKTGKGFIGWDIGEHTGRAGYGGVAGVQAAYKIKRMHYLLGGIDYRSCLPHFFGTPKLLHC